MVLGAGILFLLSPPAPTPSSVPMVSLRQALWDVLEQGNHLGRLANSAADRDVEPGAQLPPLIGQGRDCAKGVAHMAKRRAQGQEP